MTWRRLLWIHNVYEVSRKNNDGIDSSELFYGCDWPLTALKPLLYVLQPFHVFTLTKHMSLTELMRASEALYIL